LPYWLIGVAYVAGLTAGIIGYAILDIIHYLLRIMAIIRNKLPKLPFTVCFGLARYSDDLNAFGITIEKLVTPCHVHRYINISLWHVWIDIGIRTEIKYPGVEHEF